MKYVGVKTTGELKLHEVKEPQTDEIYMAVEDTKLGAVPIRPYEFAKWDGTKWVKVDNVELATTLDIKNVEDEFAAIEGKIPSDTTSANKLVNESGLQDAIDEAARFHKNASAYGFSPTANGDENADALSSAVAGGGTIVVDIPGVYDISKSTFLPSNTRLVFGNGVKLRRVAYDGHYPTYLFANAGVQNGTSNENIEIDGLDYEITQSVEGSTRDVARRQNGLRGMLMFENTKNLILKKIKIYNSISNDEFSIQATSFENVIIDDFCCDSMKDGIHLGPGSKIVIKNCIFHTADDAIALNAVDYQGSTTAYGNIENVVISDIFFEENNGFAAGRGIYALVGAWDDWYSGMSVQKYGQIVVSDGRVYVSANAGGPTTDRLTSTDQPTHESGTVTYPDGLSWRMYQNSAVYNAVVKNLFVSNVISKRTCGGMFTFNVENNAYIQSSITTANNAYCENIVIENTRCEVSHQNFVKSLAPIKALRINKCFMRPWGSFIALGTSSDTGIVNETTLSMAGNYYDVSEATWHTILQSHGGAPIRGVILGSIKSDPSVTLTTDGNVTVTKDV